MSETWKAIHGFPGYDVSDIGRVRSYWVRGKPSWISDEPQRIMKGSFAGKYRNYPFVLLRKGGKSYGRLVHVLVLLAFVGPKPEGTQVCHYDDNPSNNNLSNLRYGTPSENKKDAIRNGRTRGHSQSPEAGLITVREAAQQSGLSERAIRWACKNGRIEGAKPSPWRFSLRSFRRWRHSQPVKRRNRSQR